MRGFFKRTMKKETPQLATKLRHIDIHQHWLQQEVQNGNIHIDWINANGMPADGLTKTLPRQNREIFVRQLGLVSIKDSHISLSAPLG
jgi:hypothetical protein